MIRQRSVDLKARRTKMNEVLELLKQMDVRRRAEGKDQKENPAQLHKSLKNFPDSHLDVHTFLTVRRDA